jgi:hypothetical protein
MQGCRANDFDEVTICDDEKLKRKSNQVKEKAKAREVKETDRFSDLSSRMYCRVKYLSTDVSDVRAASIIALMM